MYIIYRFKTTIYNIVLPIKNKLHSKTAPKNVNFKQQNKLEKPETPNILPPVISGDKIGPNFTYDLASTELVPYLAAV